MKNQYLQYYEIAKKIVLGSRFTERFYTALQRYRLTSNAQTKTKGGFFFFGPAAMKEGNFEKVETSVFKNCMKECQLVINVGANIGYYCCIALNSEKRVIAVEPIDTNLEILYLNIKANHWQQAIEIYPMALSESPGLIDIYGIGTSASLLKGWAGTPSRSRRTIPTQTLDNILACRFAGTQALVLMDVEGAELSVLKGAVGTLERAPKPIWLIEISIDTHFPDGVAINPNLQETFETFWARGYQSWVITEKPRLVERDEIELIKRTKINTIESHNFLMLDSTWEGRNRVLEHDLREHN